MPTNKTVPTTASVAAFITTAAQNAQQLQDSHALVTLMSGITGEPPKMWGPSIIGFGHYHYRYASGHEGDAPLLGFSPRKAAISLYVYTGAAQHALLLQGLGNFKMGKACIYIKKLADIQLPALKKIMEATLAYYQQQKIKK